MEDGLDDSLLISHALQGKGEALATLSDDLAQICGEQRLRIQKLEEALRPFAGKAGQFDACA